MKVVKLFIRNKIVEILNYLYSRRGVPLTVLGAIATALTIILIIGACSYGLGFIAIYLPTEVIHHASGTGEYVIVATHMLNGLQLLTMVLITGTMMVYMYLSWIAVYKWICDNIRIARVGGKITKRWK